MNEYFKDPVWLLAAGGAVGLALCGILVGLSELVPALGLMFSLAATGAAAGFTLSPAIGTVASYGAAATGAVLSIQLFVRITREAKKKPMVWGTSIISLLSGLLVQICEPFWNGSKITWIMFSVIAALLVIIGSVFYAQNKMEFKIIGALTSLLTPGMVLV